MWANNKCKRNQLFLFFFSFFLFFYFDFPFLGSWCLKKKKEKSINQNIYWMLLLGWNELRSCLFCGFAASGSLGVRFMFDILVCAFVGPNFFGLGF